MANMITVESASDWTIVIDVPQLSLHRSWSKRGQKLLIDRDILVQAFYEPGIEVLFREGKLVVHDKDFLTEVGLITADGKELVTHMDETLMKRMISLMPLTELKQNAAKLSRSQLDELFDYAVDHYTQVKMDRIDILNKVTGRNLMKTIENFKASQEG